MSKKKMATAAIVLSALLLNIFILKTVAYEPYWLLKVSLLCVVVDLTAYTFIRNMEVLLRVPIDIYRDRGMVWVLVKNDFQARFAGSYLGLFWAFVHPVITIALYWFVFQVGLRAGDMSEHPFILFLMAGLVPWFYCSEAWSGASNCLIEYNYLVKKVVFNIGILPFIKVASALFVHIFFTGVILFMCTIYGYGIDLYTLQLFYYIAAAAALAIGASYITSALTVFIKDMSQVVNIVLTIGVWATPIMWNPAVNMPSMVHNIFKINPVYYIVDGFRDALLNKEWFWEKPVWTLYFWCVAIFLYLFGVKLFNRLKVHFSDVL